MGDLQEVLIRSLATGALRYKQQRDIIVVAPQIMKLPGYHKFMISLAAKVRKLDLIAQVPIMGEGRARWS